jgi:glycosidase
MSKPIIYQLFPRWFTNYNETRKHAGTKEENGCGRFVDINERALKAIVDLGATHVWYTGVIRHATAQYNHPAITKGKAGSPYAITDYYDVDPDLAKNESKRMEEFEALVKRTHEAGLGVIIDFVPNHVSREYKSLCKPAAVKDLGEGDHPEWAFSPLNDFYYLPGQRFSMDKDLQGYEEFPAKVTGNDCFTSHPSENDWYETVKLNYCDTHTATWDKMLDIVLYWAGMGVDGFRCDMVELVPPSFMQWLIAGVKRVYPAVLFIAEVYQKDRYRQYVEEVGFDLLYDKSGLYDTLRAVSCDGVSARRITENWQFLGDLQPHMLNFLENHDEQRLASDFFCGKPEAGYAALAVSLLLNDAPFLLYFGQEGGERGMQKEGFSGLDGRTSIFDWCKVPALEKPDRKVLARYEDILYWSKHPVFAKGATYDLCYAQGEGFNPDRHFAFLRAQGHECYLVVSNFGPSADIHVRIPAEALSFLGIHAQCTSFTLSVPSSDFALVKVS